MTAPKQKPPLCPVTLRALADEVAREERQWATWASEAKAADFSADYRVFGRVAATYGTLKRSYRNRATRIERARGKP